MTLMEDLRWKLRFPLVCSTYWQCLLVTLHLCWSSQEPVGSRLVERFRCTLQNAMLIAGIVTLVQIFTIGPIGGKLPIVMGTSSGFIGVCQSVSAVMGNSIGGYGAIMAACFIGGLFETILGSFLKPLRKFFPSVVTGTVVCPSVFRWSLLESILLEAEALPMIMVLWRIFL